MPPNSERGVTPVICVDGPGGSGKGVLASTLAEKLGWRHLDSGVLYRAVAALALDAEVGLEDEAALACLAEGMDAEADGGRLNLNGADRSADIRQEQVAKAASAVAWHPAVRAAVLQQQRNARQAPGLVADGRDMGTVVFPDAELKIFLDASTQERARRRHRQLRSDGMRVNFHTVLASIRERDGRDSRRAASPLRPAEDAVVIDSTEMTIAEVLDRALALVGQRRLGEGGAWDQPTLIQERPHPNARRSHGKTNIPMSESFAELFEESLNTIEMAPGAIITGTVVDIDNEMVVVHAGLKSEGVIPKSEFVDENGGFALAIGDQVKVAMEIVDDGRGETWMSREKAKRAETWQMLEEAYENSKVVNGIINGKVKGGFTVDVKEIRAFLPGSLVDIRPLRETAHLEGRPLDFHVIKLDQKRNNVVVSRRTVLEQENSEEREALLASLQEGMDLTGIVKNLTAYGAFVDLGGIDGLLHITDMAWRRIRHPSEMVNVGDEVQVRILKFDRDKNRVSLGMKQLGEDPWADLVRRYPVNSRVFATVTNLTDYGCFAEIEEGVEGLVHVSEMDWANKNIHPSKVVNVGDEVEVMILDIDEGRRRISLGIKQCRPNPWDEFAANHAKGDRIRGKIKSITDFGIFVGLDGAIDGLVYLSDISWNEPGENVVRRYSKGEEIETVILSMDPERERIALGIKQLDRDPFTEYVTANDRGTLVKGVVEGVSPKEASLRLAEDVTGVLKASEISIDRMEDARKGISEGQELELKIISVDRKNRLIGLSLKAKALDEERAAVREHRAQEREQGAAKKGGTLGDLIQAQLQGDKKTAGS